MKHLRNEIQMMIIYVQHIYMEIIHEKYNEALFVNFLMPFHRLVAGKMYDKI